MKAIKVTVRLVLSATVIGAYVGAEAPLSARREPVRPLTLDNGKAALTIIPEIGGRVVEYRLKGRGNVLLADPAAWAKPEDIPLPAGDAPWRTFNGHIYWLSPQAQFWAHQTINPERKGGWPPDPWQIYGHFKLVEKTDSAVKLQGPPSEATGIQMTKTFTLKADGDVEVTVTASNMRKTPVAWAIWSNTRVPVQAHSYVLLGESTRMRFSFRTGQPLAHTYVRYKIIDGFFAYQTRSVPEGFVRQSGKVFFSNTPGDAIAAFVGDTLFVKRVPITPRDKLPPDQGYIELYSHIHPEQGAIVELEMHGPYTRLAPGESMAMAETWQLHPYDGPEDPKAHTALLRKLLR